jgi:hypothetical protein
MVIRGIGDLKRVLYIKVLKKKISTNNKSRKTRHQNNLVVAV